MDPIITPALILLGLLAVHSKTGGNPGAIGEKSAAEPNDLPEDAGPEEIEFSHEWRHAALDVRADGAQSFKPRVASAIEKGLSNVSLERVAVDGAETSALVFRVVPGAGDLSVAKAVQIGREKGLAVLATLAITIPDTTAERYVMLCKVSEISMAARGTNLAVLHDPTALALGAKANPVSVAGSHAFDTRAGDGGSTSAPAAQAPTVIGSVMTAEVGKSPLAESVPPAKAEKPKRVKKAKAPKAEIVAVAAPTEPLNGMNHKPRNAEKSENVDELPVV